MFRLLINGEQAELSDKTRIKLNRKIFNFQNLSERGVRFTNAFTLPSTQKNLRLVGSPNQLASNNDSFETSKRYTLIDSNTIVSEGQVIVKSYDEKKGVKIQLSEGLDFWSIAEKSKMNALNVHDEDFQFNTSNMNARKTDTGSIFRTALHDATATKTNTALTNYNYTRPCYVFRYLLDRVATDLGYTIDYGDVLNNTKLNDIGCLSNSRDFFVTDYKKRFEQLNFSGTLDISSGSTHINIGDNTTLSGSTLNINLYNTAFVIKGTVTSNVNTSIEFVFNDRTERIIIPQGTSFVNFVTDTSEIGSTVYISCPDEVTFNDVYLYSIVSESDIFDVTASTDLTGRYVLADYNLPIITYKSFIKMIMKMFFLNVDIDNQRKILKFSELGGSINTNNFVDISDRTQRNNNWKSGKIYAKLNSLSYSNDDDVNSNLGTAFINVNNENAKDTKALISISEFSASNEVTISGNRVIQVNIYDITEAKRKSVNDRIVFFNQSGSFGFNATFSELSFQRLYSDHYFDFIESTKRERLISFSVYLDNTLFRKLQDTPLVYIDFMSSYFLVSEIKGFDRDSMATLDTVKYG